MGGTNEKTIGGLRFHVSSGKVHIHDDTKNLKFEMKSSEFATQYDDAMEALKRDDGIVMIAGSKNPLCLCKANKNVNAFILPNQSNFDDIEKFVESL